MPPLDHFDLPMTCERIYERAEEIVASWGKTPTDREWGDAILAAAAEARKIETQLH